MADNRYRRRHYKKSYRRKKSHSTLWIALIMFGVWYALFGKEIITMALPTMKETEVKQKVETVNEGKPYNMMCTEANVAKILARTLIENETSYSSNIEEGIWYNKYYDALEKELGFTYLKKEEALKGVTYQQVAEILNHVLGEGYGVDVKASEENLNKMITINEFLESYTKALSHTGKGIQLNSMECTVIATPATYEKLGAWKVATDSGEYGFEGIILDPLKGQTIKAIIKDKEILAVTHIMSEESVIKQCYILKVSDQNAEVQIGDIKLNYENQALTNKEEGTICNLHLKANKIVDYDVQENKNTDTLVRVTKDYVELQKAGRLNYDYVMVYDRTQTGDYKTLEELPCNVKVEYTMTDNKLTSLQIVKESDKEKIRVLLSNGKDSTYLHDNVQVKSEKAYDVVCNDQTKVLNAGIMWEAKAFNWSKDVNCVKFIPKEDSCLKILTLSKKEKNPEYKGTIEIIKDGDTFLVINELDLEDYVAGVIPSEMPLSYGEEAAKVQAVAARTYATAAKKSSKYISYGAQIDDTTNSQVYMTVAPTEASYKAANATKGQILQFNDSTISSKFFATSCGYTANFGEVWASGTTFPTNTPVYLVSRQQYVGDKLISDMSDEKEAYKFLKMGADEVDAFDKNSPWFRWQVKLDADELAALMGPALNKMSKAYPDLVKVLDEDKTWKSGEIDSIGSIKDLQVKKRGQGGNIMELVVVGEKAVVKVSTEYLIRSLFSTNDKQSLTVTRADTTEVKAMSLLPSAFFSMDMTYDKANELSTLTLYGGGFGHGVGMSQDGVRGMAKRGYTYREILKHYYPNIEIKSPEKE